MRIDVLPAEGGPVLGLEPRTLGAGGLTLCTGGLAAIALDFLASAGVGVRKDGERGQGGTDLQDSHARQTLLRWSWMGFEPTSGGMASSSMRFFFD